MERIFLKYFCFAPSSLAMFFYISTGLYGEIRYFALLRGATSMLYYLSIYTYKLQTWLGLSSRSSLCKLCVARCMVPSMYHLCMACGCFSIDIYLFEAICIVQSIHTICIWYKIIFLYMEIYRNCFGLCREKQCLPRCMVPSNLPFVFRKKRIIFRGMYGARDLLHLQTRLGLPSRNF